MKIKWPGVQDFMLSVNKCLRGIKEGYKKLKTPILESDTS